MYIISHFAHAVQPLVGFLLTTPKFHVFKDVQSKQDTIISLHYRIPKPEEHCSSILVLFNLSDSSSLSAALKTLDDVNTFHCQKILIGAMHDENRSIDNMEPRIEAFSRSANYTEVCPKTGHQVEDLWRSVSLSIPPSFSPINSEKKTCDFSFAASTSEKQVAINFMEGNQPVMLSPKLTISFSPSVLCSSPDKNPSDPCSLIDTATFNVDNSIFDSNTAFFFLSSALEVQLDDVMTMRMVAYKAEEFGLHHSGSLFN